MKRICLILLAAGQCAGAADLPPYSHKVYDDLKLAAGVTIDEPDRLVVWVDKDPIVVVGGKDPVKWAGDPRYWAAGEFVENNFPKEYPPGTPGVNIRCSKHIRIIYGNHPTMTDEYVLGNLRMFEECLKLYYLKLGFPVPFEARDPKKRDGKKHKIDVLVGGSNLPPHNGREMFTAGGCWGCWDGDRAMGYLACGPTYMRHTPPSGATPHELAHACQMQCNVHSPGSGFWWEAHANWMMLQFINTYPPITIVNPNASFYWGHGRHYYDCWQIFEHLKDEPGFGYDFVTRLWRDGEDMLYLWNKAEQFAAPRSMADEWGKMARRNVTWDYARHDIFVKQDTDQNKIRFGRTVLEPVPLQPGWYRVPWALAPQQFGYNICPLKPTAATVTADLRGLVDPERGSGWSASFVAVNAAGQPRYSTLWSGGPNSIALRADDKELYLVVSATPKVMEIRVEDDYRGTTKATFPYTVKLDGAVPLDLLALQPPAGKPHPNGGGFVAASAKVDPTAYVGPNAAVLGHAKVLDHAHIADYAVVKDNAVVSGHARVLEYGSVVDQSQVTDSATIKGRAVPFGKSRVAGTAILDGDYANSLTVAKGVWFHWFVNDQKKVDAGLELHGLCAEYKFAKKHPYLAWDTHGATHGLLVGAPVIQPGATNALVFNGRDQYVELRRDLVCQYNFGIELLVRRDPQATDAVLLDFATRDATNRLGLAIAPTGQPRLFVRGGSTNLVLVSPLILPVNQWTKLAVALTDTGTTLLVNDRIVAENRAVVHPWDLRLQCGFLGRGLGGNHFKGSLAAVKFYSVPFVDRSSTAATSQPLGRMAQTE